MNNLGQIQTIINIIIFVITVALAAVISPILSGFMNEAINSTNATGTSLLLMQSVVPVFWIGIIITFFILIGAGRQSQNGL